MQDILGDGGILKEVVHEGEGPLVPRDASVSSKYQTQHCCYTETTLFLVIVKSGTCCMGISKDIAGTVNALYVHRVNSPLFWIPGVLGSAF